MYIVDGQQEREGPWQGWYGPGRWTGHAMRMMRVCPPPEPRGVGTSPSTHPSLPSPPLVSCVPPPSSLQGSGGAWIVWVLSTALPGREGSVGDGAAALSLDGSNVGPGLLGEMMHRDMQRVCPPSAQPAQHWPNLGLGSSRRNHRARPAERRGRNGRGWFLGSSISQARLWTAAPRVVPWSW